ncbi:conjugative transposon protein TraN [Chitinophaga sp. GbtcB8]|uniref:conjugative transposon protein TraN n=1 Tax=Chitinophaga sp. GbtcB8 TaxID=2824753 RepID=UPI001C306DC3|nr:conjugative transposon protein TraN [Chitinophaga sp. GbtcB8]
MKAIIKIIMALTLMAGVYTPSLAQATSETSKLSLGKVDPYLMDVTYNKTTHVIFPAAIRYVDLGSEYLVAGKAADAENVLRIKASVRDFEDETNCSVITEDGRFYNFNVYYSSFPAILSYDLQKMQKASDRQSGNDVLFEELGNTPPSLAGLLMETIYKKDKRIVKHISSRSYGIQFSLKGIYIHDGKFYFHTELRNKSNVPFDIDFVNFKVVDKKVAKRTVVQERALMPLRLYKPLEQVAGNAVKQNVFLLDKFTVSNDKVLLIEIFEKNGGRQQVLQVENADLVGARAISNMHLKPINFF